MGPVLDSLRGYAAGAVSAERLVRALIEHDGYFVPLAYLDAIGARIADFVLVLDPAGGPPAGELWLFTDEAHARRAGQKVSGLGAYAGAFDGVRVFGALDRSLATVRINPLTSVETSWVIERAAVPLARAWARGVALERRIVARTQPGGADRLAAALRAHDALAVLVRPGGTLMTATGAAGFRNPALAFTTADCAHALLADAHAHGLHLSTLDGRSLLAAVREGGHDGLIFNLRGPGPTWALGREACAIILEE
jgi:hypothetical protein